MTEVLSDEQGALRDAVRTLLVKRSGSAAVRRAVDTPAGYDESLWQVLCQQIGVAALAVPEKFGGVGAGPREIQLVSEELGRTLTPSPFLGSVLAASLLTALDDGAAADRLLPRIAEGTVAAVAWAGADGRWAHGAVRADGDRLTGEAHYVLDGDVAEVVLVIAGGAVYEVEPSAVERSRTPAMDPTRCLARIGFDAVTGTRIGPADARPALETARDAVLVALAAEQVGTAARALEMTVEYAKVRHQFGRPIGSFQALKHRMADLYVLLEAARSAAYGAAAGSVHPSAAKIYCTEALRTIAAETIQLHGGIAITWEHDAHLYFKRAHSSGELFGSPAVHVDRLAGAAIGRSTHD